MALADIANKRGPNKSLCPSEAARAVGSDGWRDLLERTRYAVNRLAENGVVEVTQKGRVVEPWSARGPIRVRIRRQ